MDNNLSDFQNRYRVLQEQFCADLSARLEHILTTGHNWLATETQAMPDDEFLISAHKLAGSAGSFGFPEISTLCQQIEDAIRENNSASRQAIPGLLDQLRAFIK